MLARLDQHHAKVLSTSAVERPIDQIAKTSPRQPILACASTHGTHFPDLFRLLGTLLLTPDFSFGSRPRDGLKGIFPNFLTSFLIGLHLLLVVVSHFLLDGGAAMRFPEWHGDDSALFSRFTFHVLAVFFFRLLFLY
jgi:hypothetical protein